MYLADGAGEGRVLAHLHRDVLHVVHEPRLHPRAHCGQNSFLYFQNVYEETLKATINGLNDCFKNIFRNRKIFLTVKTRLGYLGSRGT